MPLPTPQKSTASHFYKYSGPANLGWLKDVLHKHEIYLPTLTQTGEHRQKEIGVTPSSTRAVMPSWQLFKQFAATAYFSNRPK